MPFTAKDQDRDTRPDFNCAVFHQAGFWYDSCSTVLLFLPTGDPRKGGTVKGTYWGGFGDLSRMELMVSAPRP